jgi:SAM-dependent methyltransferase
MNDGAAIPDRQAAPPQTQTWKADRYAHNARFVADLGAPVLAFLAPQPGEKILDLGCGDGALTEKLVATGADVVGVDASAAMVEAARAKGLNAEVMDGGALTFDGVFDAVFSNAALHWMLDPNAVIAGVRRALKPGGRFVAEFGGHGNVAAITVALIAALERRGIDGQSRNPWFELLPRPTPLPTDITGWLDTFGENFFRAVPAAERDAVKQEVVALLRPCLCDERGNWTADYVRLRFAARL